MQILTLDFETFFDDDYTLKKLTTEAYIRDPRFETLCVCVRHPDGTKGQYRGDAIAQVFSKIDWSKTGVLAHHAHFDGLILSHHYGVKPAFWFDTLSMARLMLGNHLSVALSSLAQHYGLAAKTIDYSAATGFRGKRACNLTPALWTDLMDGCSHDVALTWDLFKTLCKGFPAEEFRVIDFTVRMFTEPRLVGDRALFEQVAQSEFLRKNEALMALGVTKGDLQSSAKFCALLEAEGIEIEWKDGKNGKIPAVAKTDDFMRQLEEHENDRVATLAAARVEGKSTLDETRAGRLAGMSGRGALPVYLGYSAAHTTRWGGGDKVNLQNLRRGGDLRRGICAPKGYLIAVADKSQIECRLLNYVAGQEDVIARFRRQEDPYVNLASKFYGREITKADKPERGLGKLGELSCGYGAGGPSIQSTAKRGTYGPAVELTDAQGLEFRDLYRHEHPMVTRYWQFCDKTILPALANGESWVHEPSCLEINKGRLVGPSGVPMHYVLDWQFNEAKGYYGWARKTRRGWRGIWGGGLTENIMQYLGRIDIGQTILRIDKRCVIKPVLTTHDDAAFLVPEAEGETYMAAILEEFRRSPAWMPDIPLDAEGGLSERYVK